MGALSLTPIVGGSGGGGYDFCDGGGGGGAVVIASSASVLISAAGIIDASGRPGRCGSLGDSGSIGAAGAVRIVANSIDIKGNISATIARLEAPSDSLVYSGSGTIPILARVNPVIVTDSNGPSLTIASIGGYTVPPYSAARLGRIDLMLPRQLPDPIPVVIRSSNIPVGTQVKVNISGPGSSTTGTLTGTLQSSSATISISGLDKGGAVTYLYAYTVFDLPKTAQNFNLKGRDEIAQVRIEAAPGAKSKYVFLRKDGSEVERSKVLPQLLQQFGGLE